MDNNEKSRVALVDQYTLAETDESGVITAQIQVQRIEIASYSRSVVVSDVTPEARLAAVEQARQTFAIPAQEKTARTREMTKWETQFTIRHAMVVLAVLILAFLIWSKPESAVGIAALGAVLGGVYLGTTYMTKKQEGIVKGKRDDADIA